MTTNFRLHLWQIFRKVSQAMSCIHGSVHMSAAIQQH